MIFITMLLMQIIQIRDELDILKVRIQDNSLSLEIDGQIDTNDIDQIKSVLRCFSTLRMHNDQYIDVSSFDRCAQFYNSQ